MRWSAHAGGSSPYTISPALFERVGWANGEALGRDLNIVLNVHHYDELNDAPSGQRPRFLGLWRQIAARYAGWPGRLCLELLNEPRAAMTAGAWNELIPLALAVVRDRDPGRAVIVGPARVNDIGALPELELPDDDRLVVTVHYYAPLEFTRQGAPWRAGAGQWLGTTWGDDADRRAASDDLARAARLELVLLGLRHRLRRVRPGARRLARATARRAPRRRKTAGRLTAVFPRPSS